MVLLSVPTVCTQEALALCKAPLTARRRTPQQRLPGPPCPPGAGGLRLAGQPGGQQLQRQAGRWQGAAPLLPQPGHAPGAAGAAAADGPAAAALRASPIARPPLLRWRARGQWRWGSRPRCQQRAAHGAASSLDLLSPALHPPHRRRPAAQPSRRPSPCRSLPGPGAAAAVPPSPSPAAPPPGATLAITLAVDDFPLDSGWAVRGGRRQRVRQGGGRALRLEGSETWVPFSAANTQRPGGSQHSAGERALAPASAPDAPARPCGACWCAMCSGVCFWRLPGLLLECLERCRRRPVRLPGQRRRPAA
jgi:hypothetical protein